MTIENNSDNTETVEQSSELTDAEAEKFKRDLENTPIDEAEALISKDIPPAY